MTGKTLEEYREKIRKERKWVGKKQYSHNIIGLVLGMIADEYSQEEANKAVKDFRLTKLGW